MGGVIVGQPFGCVVQAMEHDEGDPNAYRTAVEAIVKAAAAYAKFYDVEIPGFIQGAVANLLNDFLGSGDDKLGVGSFSLDAAGLEWFSQQPLITF